MTRDDTLRTALDLGADMYCTDRIEFWMPAFWKFVEKVRESEREACARVVEASPSYDWHRFACEAAAAIRARGQQ